LDTKAAGKMPAPQELYNLVNYLAVSGYKMSLIDVSYGSSRNRNICMRLKEDKDHGLSQCMA
jgi:hypothetical protein